VRFRAVLTLALAACGTSALSAQTTSLDVTGPSALREGTSLSAADALGASTGRFPNLDVSSAVQGNHRKEGAIIGGSVLGLTMLLVSLEANKYGDAGSVNVPLVTIGGAAIGALLGAFIGGWIPKEDEPEQVPATGT
jgi:hypothetical protein